jgi:phosphonopyruvate decarboxylase
MGTLGIGAMHGICNDLDLKYFTGVPDSTFKGWISFLESGEGDFQHRVAANEGAAVGHAAGYHLATGKVPVVYMQNSGLGNCVNPLTSLANSAIYGIPMVLMVGWRGEPGQKDEPQHAQMGKILEPLLNVLDIPFVILEAGSADVQIREMKEQAVQESSPVALVIRKGLFQSFGGGSKPGERKGMSREEALEQVLDSLKGNEIFVGTTGKTSRELFELRAKRGQGHGCDFYTVGSMGHASAIAMELALQMPRRDIYLLDGDGAVIMHMGTLGTIGSYQPSNLHHILLDNQCHESTGGQPTVSEALDFKKIALGNGYQSVECCHTPSELAMAMASKVVGPRMVVVGIRPGSRSDLGRPTTSPRENKVNLMRGLSQHAN